MKRVDDDIERVLRGLGETQAEDGLEGRVLRGVQRRAEARSSFAGSVWAFRAAVVVCVMSLGVVGVVRYRAGRGASVGVLPVSPSAGEPVRAPGEANVVMPPEVAAQSESHSRSLYYDGSASGRDDRFVGNTEESGRASLDTPPFAIQPQRMGRPAGLSAQAASPTGEGRPSRGPVRYGRDASGRGDSNENMLGQQHGKTERVDYDALALEEMLAPSMPAPPLPLTAQERLLLRTVNSTAREDLAMLSMEGQEREEAEGRREVQQFFQASGKHNE